uniref:Solute carrier family 22 member 5-like n=1 Tax=Sparus aurata TaxID=8175 RepID=A0A671X9C1_SPAAU
MNDYDESIAFLGHWGCFQKTVFFLLCASTIPNGTGVLSIIFVADIPAHHCRIPEANLTQDWLNVVIPTEVVNGKQEQSSCSRYRLDVVRNLSAQGFIPGRDVNLTELQQEGCVDGWSYSRDIYQSTIVSQFDLVCADQWKQPFSSTVYFLGVLCGSFFAGQLSDRFGRKPVFFITMACQTIFTFAQVFSPSWTVFSILLFLSGLGQIGNYVSAFVLGSEILSGKVRVLYASLGVCLCFALGFLILPLFAYFLRDWKSLLLALSLPALLYIPLWWFIPESPRWLVSQGRVEEAEAIVRNAAKKNHIEAPKDIFQNFIVTAVEVPAYISAWLALAYLPRRYAASSAVLLGAVSLFLIQLVPQNLPELFIAMEMLGKYGFTTSSSIVFTYTTEIYPTAIRSTATGTCATISRVGSCIAPFVFQLGVYFKYLPYILLGSLAVVSAIATLFLPETFGKPLPETFEQMGKRER